MLEIAAVDPQLGAVFYTVNQDKDEPVRFRRDLDCLSCHGAARSMGVPGFVLRSLETEANGEPISGTETESVTHCTPIAQRWGGWYVTETPPDWSHRGNRPGGASGSPEEPQSQRVDFRHYPGKGSKVLPLLVHDHQTHMHNYFTRVAMEARQTFAMYGHIRYLRHQEDALLRYLLFAEEAPLPAPLAPDPEFIAAFQKEARRDRMGRSLRDFDLQTRLFKYPCSFLIESEAFQKLPPILKDQLLRKLWEILTGHNPNPVFAAIAPEARQATLEILRDTLPDLPDYWKTNASASLSPNPPAEPAKTPTTP